MKTLAIMGAGPGVDLSLAKTFGQRDFRVALIARQREKLDAYVQQVQELHSEAAGFSADVLNAAQLEGALIHVKETFGPVDELSRLCHARPGSHDAPGVLHLYSSQDGQTRRAVGAAH